MDMSQSLESFKQKHSSGVNNKSANPADSYVTQEEMQEFKRDVQELISLLLEFYIASAIELEVPPSRLHPY